MARVLGVGVAALDIINVVEAYPDEDSEVRALGQRCRLGGNTANTLTVLSQLGHRCSWAGEWVDEPEGRRIRAALEARGIATETSRCRDVGKSPTSYVTVSRATGSRTIVHYRDLPEYSYDTFAGLNLEPFDWIHFEGRTNVTDLRSMLARVRSHHPRIGISLEVEKPRQGIEALLHLPDLVLFSAHYAQQAGYSEASEFLTALDSTALGIRVCAWGQAGAWAVDPTGHLYAQPADPHVQVVETLGAGDTFNAGVIDGSLRDEGVSTCLFRGVRLAGRKCGQEGLDGLVEVPD